MLWGLQAIPLVIWLFLRVILPNQRWEFDWDVQHATFTLLIGQYMKLVGGMVVLDLWLAVRGMNAGLSRDVAGICVSGAVYGIIFLAYLLTTYERYVHTRYPRDGSEGMSFYTTSQYALVRTFGYATMVFTICGVTWTLIR